MTTITFFGLGRLIPDDNYNILGLGRLIPDDNHNIQTKECYGCHQELVCLNQECYSCHQELDCLNQRMLWLSSGISQPHDSQYVNLIFYCELSRIPNL
jgi:hypothetical protein